MERLSSFNISRNQREKIVTIGQKISLEAKKIISENAALCVVPYPQNVLHTGLFLKDSKTRDLYNIFIDSKAKAPVGMHRWAQKYNLSEDQIKNAFVFAQVCTVSNKSRNFQYKISTYILPTREYLWNYQVKENYYCSRCISIETNPRLERDNIPHCLFSCPCIAHFLLLNFFYNLL